jgi:hypothetical protein
MTTMTRDEIIARAIREVGPGAASKIAAMMPRETDENLDLLDVVPVEPAGADLPSPRQMELISKLMTELRSLDEPTWQLGLDYMVRMRGHWTLGRDGNASRWIDRLIAKLGELRTARATGTDAPALPEVPDGRYAVQYEGEVRCYHLETGKAGTRWDGFRFLSRRSSDDLFPIRNAGTKAEILALIAADIEGAAVRFALTVRECRRCHRALTDTKNPYYGVGLGPECGAK